MGKLCHNTQYFVTKTKRWRREATRKKVRELQVWTPYPQSSIRHDYDLRILRYSYPPDYNSSLLLTSTLVNVRVQISAISNCMMHMILV